MRSQWDLKQVSWGTQGPGDGLGTIWNGIFDAWHRLLCTKELDSPLASVYPQSSSISAESLWRLCFKTTLPRGGGATSPSSSSLPAPALGTYPPPIWDLEFILGRLAGVRALKSERDSSVVRPSVKNIGIVGATSIGYNYMTVKTSGASITQLSLRTRHWETIFECIF